MLARTANDSRAKGMNHEYVLVIEADKVLFGRKHLGNVRLKPVLWNES